MLVRSRSAKGQMYEEKWTHTFFCYGASDGGTFHFSLGVDNYASIVLVKMGSSTSCDVVQ